MPWCATICAGQGTSSAPTGQNRVSAGSQRADVRPMTIAPYLSIIITGRNDDFGGDFNTRLFRALEFNHHQLSARGEAHEVIVVERRAHPDANSLSPKLQFQEFIPKNVGIRRSRGRYILTTNTHIYLRRGVLDLLEH